MGCHRFLQKPSVCGFLLGFLFSGLLHAESKIAQLSVFSENLSTFAGSFVGSVGLNAEYLIDSKWNVYASYTRWSRYLFGGSIYLASTTTGARYFFDENFYAKLGLSEQKASLSSSEWRLDSTAYVLEFAIGSQFGSGWFFWGVDWIGVFSSPLASRLDTDVPATANSYNANKESMLARGRIRGPHVYLGYRF